MSSLFIFFSYCYLGVPVVKHYLFSVRKILPRYTQSRESQQDTTGSQDASIYDAHRRAEESTDKKSDGYHEASNKYVFVNLLLSHRSNLPDIL